MEDVVYCIDTSSFVDLQQLYPLRTFSSLWDNLKFLIQAERLIAPKEVLKELKRQDDEVAEWAMYHKKMFAKLDQEQVIAVSKILAEFPGLVDYSKETADADPFVIALAMVRLEAQQQLFETKYIVVTQEGHRGNSVKIPLVCKHYGIEAVNLLGLIKREKWKF